MVWLNDGWLVGLVRMFEWFGEVLGFEMFEC